MDKITNVNKLHPTAMFFWQKTAHATARFCELGFDWLDYLSRLF